VHKLFAKQLAKATRAAGDVDIDALGRLVSAAYEDADRDRRRTDRSISLMVEELDRLNRGLEQRIADRTAELKEREQALHAQNLRFDAAISNMSQGLVMFDAAARLVIANQRYLDMYGLSPQDVTPGLSLRDLLEHRIVSGAFVGDSEHYVRKLLEELAQGKTVSEATELADGRTIVVVSRPMPNGGWVATHEDITERRRAEKRIAHMARHDALTDLPNRVLLRERLAHAVLEVNRGKRVAVLYLDLDRFKTVNDTLGHPIGDELLKAVSDRLRRCVGEADTVARVGGDEFAIIQPDIGGPNDAATLARVICDAVKAPYELGGHAVIADVSIGISLAPDDCAEATALLKNADMALYRAKADGRGTYRFFEPEMDARMRGRRTLELALRKALPNDQFELHYQPLLNLERNGVTSCEALLRWHHPEQGTIPPAEFIPIAEEIGLITQLGEWVIRRACGDAATWPDHIKVAVNLSPTQLTSQNLVAVVMNALASSGLAAGRLELEITEAVLMRNTEMTLAVLHQLRSLGVRISLDDFGTGYSSLSYLRSFPFDKIKIDRCFIKGLTNGEESVAIVRAVSDLAASLNMATTAEGVETQAQLDQVRMLGCTEIQGFFFSRPVRLNEVSRLLAEREDAVRGAA
jgi:diguanylate cyclase (GGDEF)-like protein/PAS domain S-box-containing protein